ncbi:MAG: fructose-6-phosphate aldolase [Rhodospirillales bacterium]
MQFFLDTADVAEIQALAETGMVDGVTTNPTLILKSGGEVVDTIRQICDVIDGPVSAEVTATDAPAIVDEGRKLAGIAENVVIKVPLTKDGLIACRALSEEGHRVNVTLCFAPGQALLAAKAGAAYISPFVGRLDDLGQDGMELIADVVTIYENYGYPTEVLVASVRGPHHVVQAAKVGADVCTLPPKVLRQLYEHPLTDKGLAAFLADWEKTGQSIL